MFVSFIGTAVLDWRFISLIMFIYCYLRRLMMGTCCGQSEEFAVMNSCLVLRRVKSLGVVKLLFGLKIVVALLWTDKCTPFLLDNGDSPIFCLN